MSKLTLSSQGHVVVSGHSREVHSLHGNISVVEFQAYNLKKIAVYSHKACHFTVLDLVYETPKMAIITPNYSLYLINQLKSLGAVWDHLESFELI